MDTRVNDKENLREHPTPRRSTRIAVSLMMRDLPGNVTVADKSASGKKATLDTPAKTPRKSSVKKTPKKVAKDTNTPMKTPKKTPKKTPGKSIEEPKVAVSASASKRSRSAKKDVKTATPRSLRVTRSRSIDLELHEKVETPASRKNLFPEDTKEGKNDDKLEETFRIDDLKVKDVVDQGEKNLPDIDEKMEKIDEEVFKDAIQEKSTSSTPEKTEKSEIINKEEKKEQSLVLADTPEKTEKSEIIDKEMEMKEQSVVLADLAKEVGEENLADQTCVVINDSFNEEEKMEDLGSKSIIVIPDTPMPSDAEKMTHQLNETFSPEPADIVFPVEEHKSEMDEQPKKTPKKTPFKAIKSPKRLNLQSISKKTVNFSPAIASSALKSSILRDNKIMTPLKSIRKRSFSTTDVETTKKMNRVTFYSPANMEVTVDEIDGEMQPHIEKIRLERDAHVAIRAKEKKLGRKHKRSMSNVETESGKKRALQNIASEKSPAKAGPLALGKVPNFMAIHAASFKKMENLVDYKNRKDERAKNLLGSSGKSTITSSSAAAKDKDKEDKEMSVINKEPIVVPVAAKVPKAGPSQSAEGENKTAHVGTSRPLKKVEERQQKWRSMHKSGRHDNQSEAKTGQKSAILKGVRSNRRFDLMMKFREQHN